MDGVVKESTWVPHKKLDIRMICSLHIVKVDVIMINKHHSAYGWLVVAPPFIRTEVPCSFRSWHGPPTVNGVNDPGQGC
jgi:hypothetical protein